MLLDLYDPYSVRLRDLLGIEPRAVIWSYEVKEDDD